MPRIDAHQHFWNITEVDYPWFTPELDAIHKTFEPVDLEPQMNVADVERTVLVQSANSYEDTAYMLKLADNTKWVSAVIGWTDLLAPQETEKRITMYKQHPKFRGVRHLIQAEEDPGWLTYPVVHESLAVLEQHQMVFEIPALFPLHLMHVPALAEQFPKLNIVIDDLGRPPIRENAMHPWSEQLTAAAAYPNVYTKISGLNLVADWETWSSITLKPFVDYALQVFGADRVMFGSGWPSCLLAGTYQRVVMETVTALESHGKDVMGKVMGGTAAKVYRI